MLVATIIVQAAVSCHIYYANVRVTDFVIFRYIKRYVANVGCYAIKYILVDLFVFIQIIFESCKYISI